MLPAPNAAAGDGKTMRIRHNIRIMDPKLGKPVPTAILSKMATKCGVIQGNEKIVKKAEVRRSGRFHIRLVTVLK
jgi:hypothetical protein